MGAVGRIHEEHKRFGDLLEAVKRLREAHPVRAIIVGDGPDLPALKDRARFLGVDTHVVFAGRREDRELFFGLMDAFVLSSATEAAPLALMEAMMAGLPAVATTVGGVEDIAIDRETALLVPPNDVERLAAAIASSRHPVLRQSIAARAREHAVQHLSAERYAADVRALYLSELDRAARADGGEEGSSTTQRDHRGMAKPDFLVIGAQKCGTTELCASIAAHPQVCFSRPKELYFFCRDDMDVLPYPFFERESE